MGSQREPNDIKSISSVSKLKLKRARSNEYNFKTQIEPKYSPKISPQRFPKKRNKKKHSSLTKDVERKQSSDKKMNTLTLSALNEDDSSKKVRSKSGMILQSRKKNIKRGKPAIGFAINKNKNSQTEKKNENTILRTLKKKK